MGSDFQIKFDICLTWRTLSNKRMWFTDEETNESFVLVAPLTNDNTVHHYIGEWIASTCYNSGIS